jgi:hypothetical protein
MRRKEIVTGLFVVLCLILSSPRMQAQGQGVYGAITGAITDPSGAAIPGAQVTATNTATGVQTSAKSDSAGYYNVVGLTAGTYRITVSAQGFKTFIQQNVLVNIDTTVRLDVHLEVGSVAQQITVKGGPPILQTEKVELTGTITSRQLQAIPTPHNNALGLLQLLPGVLQYPGQSGLPGSNSDGYISVSANGGRAQQNAQYLDGVIDTEPIGGSADVVPPLDSLTSVTADTSNYDVEFGAVQGVVTTMTTKSGTNQWHGTLYEFNQVNATFARDPFTEPVNTGHFVWNQYGGTAGGPIKKNKVFIFGGFQGTPVRSGGAVLTTVPTAAFRQGDFSALAQTNPIFDPTTGNPDGTGRNQFTNNMIPTDRISPVSAKLLNLLPLPNRPGTDNNFLAPLGSQTNHYDTFERVDYVLNDTNRFFARYTHNWGNSGCTNVSAFGSGVAPALALPYCDASTGSDDMVTVDYVHVFSPTFVVEGRFGDMIFRFNQNALDQSSKASDAVGLTGLNGACPACGGLAGFRIGGPVGAFVFGNTDHAHQVDDEGNYDYVGIGTLTRGPHTLKFGTEIIFGNDHRRDSSSQGDFGCWNSSLCNPVGFAQSITGAPGVANSGLGVASFLLGDASAFERIIYARNLPAANQKRDAFYVQDTWRATPKLTAVLGLRYDYIGYPTSPQKGGIANFDFTNTDTVISNYGYIGPTAGVRNNHLDFAPRVGLAYRITPKTVIRTGYARSHPIGFYGANFGAITNDWPNATRQNLLQSNPFEPTITFGQGPPPFVSGFDILAAAGNPGEYPTPRDSTGFGTDVFNPTNSVDEWNFTIERQFGSSTTLTTSYVGNATRHLFYRVDHNAPPPEPGPITAHFPYAALNYFVPAYDQSNQSSSGYEGLQVNFVKRYSQGLTLTTALTWSRAYDFGLHNAMDPFNANLDRGPQDGERALILTVGHVWELPFGTGKRFLSHKGPVVSHLVSGWQFSGVTTWMSGDPLTPILSNSASLNSTCCTLRPDRIASGFVSNPTQFKWFNPSAFVTPPPYTFGNSGRGILRGPSFFEPDWSLARSFRITESKRLEFQWQVFNAFNTANLADPSTDISSVLAGQIFNVAAPMRRQQFGIHFFW